MQKCVGGGVGRLPKVLPLPVLGRMRGFEPGSGFTKVNRFSMMTMWHNAPGNERRAGSKSSPKCPDLAVVVPAHSGKTPDVTLFFPPLSHEAQHVG
jgi:hypothetical protein